MIIREKNDEMMSPGGFWGTCFVVHLPVDHLPDQLSQIPAGKHIFKHVPHVFWATPYYWMKCIEKQYLKSRFRVSISQFTIPTDQFRGKIDQFLDLLKGSQKKMPSIVLIDAAVMADYSLDNCRLPLCPARKWGPQTWCLLLYTFWLFDIAIENDSFINAKKSDAWKLWWKHHRTNILKKLIWFFFGEPFFSQFPSLFFSQPSSKLS